jgi:hypothetical protein
LLISDFICFCVNWQLPDTITTLLTMWGTIVDHQPDEKRKSHPRGCVYLAGLTFSLTYLISIHLPDLMHETGRDAEQIRGMRAGRRSGPGKCLVRADEGDGNGIVN